jgi:hypothetical protein
MTFTEEATLAPPRDRHARALGALEAKVAIAVTDLERGATIEAARRLADALADTDETCGGGDAFGMVADTERIAARLEHDQAGAPPNARYRGCYPTRTAADNVAADFTPATVQETARGFVVWSLGYLDSDRRRAHTRGED